ncbi:MAG: adenine deaminase [Armatimonadetes bacterium]|nr:adenine deaminase [Armatimonadota bacterium]
MGSKGVNIEERIAAARGEIPADLLIKNCKVVNVFSGAINDVPVAVFSGRIVGFGDYEAREVIDGKGGFLLPGFFDGHVHLESSMVTPAEFALGVVPHGTTTVVCDPHEIANVLGMDGINYILESSRHIPLNLFIMLPSCVPATTMETSGAKLSAMELSYFLQHERVLGLGEVMNFPGVVQRDKDLMEKIVMSSGRRMDGHCPKLTGKDLCAYAIAGIKSDHESTTVEEGLEKLGLGIYLMIREGTTAKNLDALLPIVTEINSPRCFFVTDDRHPNDILNEGHMDHILRRAVAKGLNPITAIQMVTINPARYFHISDIGAIAPGGIADMVIVDDLKDFRVSRVLKDGQTVAIDGELLAPRTEPKVSVPRGTININWANPLNFAIRAEKDTALVIGIIPGQIMTKRLVKKVKTDDGVCISDTDGDILKIAVVERHRASGRIGLGFVQGFGIKRGAVASSIAHDSHNIVIIGENDLDMETALTQVAKQGGGQAVVANGEVVASVPLPIAGLMSEESLSSVKGRVERTLAAVHDLGSPLHNPLMSMSFLALPVIPELKISDLGLIDVNRFARVGLFDI